MSLCVHQVALVSNKRHQTICLHVEETPKSCTVMPPTPPCGCAQGIAYIFFNICVSVVVVVIQAEAWIKGKLQDLKDGCNIQRCPLQDWEEASQTLQRDLKDFENTLIQLNQVMIRLNARLESN